MHFNTLSLFPEFFEAYSKFGVLKKALDSKELSLNHVHLRDYAIDKHGTVDDYPFGGGDGMVMRCEPMAAAIQDLQASFIVHLSPKGQGFNTKIAKELLEKKSVTLICSRFAGLDQRIIDKYVDLELSLGDFILSGGELAGLSVIDACTRYLPSALNHRQSASHDSFELAFNGLLEHPLYTRPLEFEGQRVPEVLLSGDHAKIQAWKEKMSLEVTKKLRPDLLFKK